MGRLRLPEGGGGLEWREGGSRVTAKLSVFLGGATKEGRMDGARPVELAEYLHAVCLSCVQVTTQD